MPGQAGAADNSCQLFMGN